MSVGDADTTGGDDGDSVDSGGDDVTTDLPATATRGDEPDEPMTSNASTAGPDSGAGTSVTATTASGTATDPDHGDEGDSTSNSDATTGAADVAECPMSIFDVYWVEQGELEPPMALAVADANDSPKVASSAIAESGSVTVSIDFACPGEYTLWGLVWDYDPGAWGEPDPDSFYFDVGGAESTWRYGCQTLDDSSGLSWQRFAALSAQPCDASYVVLEVYEAGTVELTLRNREGGGGDQVAGIAAIAVSDDPGADPASLYDPY